VTTEVTGRSPSIIIIADRHYLVEAAGVTPTPRSVSAKAGAGSLIPLEAEAIGLPAYRQAIEFPNPDFTALARAYRRRRH
jgi:hypothetical protein